MSFNVNFNISKLPESPWFWILVAIVIFLILLASHHVATAVTMLFLAISVICLIVNLVSSSQSQNLWIACVAFLVLGVLVGIAFVPSEWQAQALPTIIQPR
jgi:uncharacterized membrane protein